MTTIAITKLAITICGEPIILNFWMYHCFFGRPYFDMLHEEEICVQIIRYQNGAHKQQTNTIFL